MGDGERDLDQSRHRKRGKSKPRFWTQREIGDVRYARISDRDGQGKMSNLFVFQLPPDMSELPQEIYNVFNELKYLERNYPDGGPRYRTTLRFAHHPQHGKCWSLANDPMSCFVCDLIDARLADLAHKIDDERTRVR